MKKTLQYFKIVKAKLKMEKLKVGDKVYCETRQYRYTRYDFAQVVRLTNKQAILSNGVRLINEPRKHWLYNDRPMEFRSVCRNYIYYVSIPEIEAKAATEKEHRDIIDWFDSKKFSESDKKIVYETFK